MAIKPVFTDTSEGSCALMMSTDMNMSAVAYGLSPGSSGF